MNTLQATQAAIVPLKHSSTKSAGATGEPADCSHVASRRPCALRRSRASTLWRRRATPASSSAPRPRSVRWARREEPLTQSAVPAHGEDEHEQQEEQRCGVLLHQWFLA